MADCDCYQHGLGLVASGRQAAECGNLRRRFWGAKGTARRGSQGAGSAVDLRRDLLDHNGLSVPFTDIRRGGGGHRPREQGAREGNHGRREQLPGLGLADEVCGRQCV